jgi:hypothetical protein
MVEQVHPSRPDWYEKFYAMAMDKGMKSYEAQVCCFIFFDKRYAVLYLVLIDLLQLKCLVRVLEVKELSP